MRNPILKQALFFLLALVFSIALMFAFVELPAWLDALLQQRAGFPGMDHGADETSRYLTDLWIDTLHLRWIGYICLGLIVVLIITGLLTRRTGWAWAGAFTLFLPVFGQFALSMFFLSGLGILRAGWLPFMDISWNILALGNVIYVPYWVLMWFFGLFGWYAHNFLAWAFMAAGAFLFVWGVMEWFNARFGGKKGVAIRSIYRMSRHPQYLGWILWSYGLMLFAIYQNNMKKSWGVESSLPWLLMTMVIIAICMLEELKMKERYGDAYSTYRSRTPFLVPLPRILKKLMRMPAQWILGKSSPEKPGDILKITATYTLALMLISTTWVDFSGKEPAPGPGVSGTLSADSLMAEIRKPGQERRDYHRHVEGIKAYGTPAVPVLIKLLDHPVPEVREFAAYALGDLDAAEAGEKLMLLVGDESGRVRNAAIQALGKLRVREAGPVLAAALANPDYDGYRYALYGALAAIQADEALPMLINGTSRPPWYMQNAALNALYDVKPDTALPFALQSLEDPDHRVRRNAVVLLLRHPRPEALVALRKMENDEDYETRFYARQAIRMIEKDGQ